MLQFNSLHVKRCDKALKAGIFVKVGSYARWIPAFAGMTNHSGYDNARINWPHYYYYHILARDYSIIVTTIKVNLMKLQKP
jgi:hypothetical protein